jgi:hypothetical protein
MPARSTVFVWLRQRPHFKEKYTFAKRFQIQWVTVKLDLPTPTRMGSPRRADRLG